MKSKIKLIISAIIAVLIILFIIVYFGLGKNIVENTDNIPPMQEGNTVRVALDLRYGKDRITIGEGSVNGLSFTKLDSDSRNSTIGVLSGAEQIGKFSGLEVYGSEFSKDNSKATFQVLSVCGAECVNFETYLADFQAGTLTRIQSPRADRDYRGDKQAMEGISYQINTFEWTSNSNIELTGFFVAQGPKGTFRVSMKEVWNYSPTTGSISLVEALPEE